MISMNEIWAAAQNHENWIIEKRRFLHRIPELGYELPKTSAYVREQLSALGIKFRYPVARSGIVAEIGQEGPCVALRADMDALPIVEEADVDFRSEHPGRMHACGHDCHTAMLLGAAKILKESEAKLPGRVKLVFQPAEEGGGGAAMMVAEGALQDPPVQKMFGIHVWPQLATGEIGGKEGTFLAASGAFRLMIKGKAGHGAYPHQCRDPIAATAQIITAIQTLVSREADPVEPRVVSVTMVHAGTAFNVIPGSVEIGGTIRAMSTAEVQKIRISLERLAKGIASALQCEAEMVTYEGAFDYPPTFNDAETWNLTQEVGKDLLSSDRVHTIPSVMGAEDFSFYAKDVPACFIALGIRNEAIGAVYDVHHGCFKVDESALKIGTAMHVGFAMRALTLLQN